MASKRDLLLVRLAIKWKWLTPEEGEDVLFLKRKFGNKLTVEQIIRRRGYLGWEEIDQLAEAATAQTGRRAAPAPREKERPKARPPRPKATGRSPYPSGEATALRPAVPPGLDAPADADEFRDGKTQIAPMPELVKAAMARAEAQEQATDDLTGDPVSFRPVEPLVIPVDMDEMPPERTIFDPRPVHFPDSDSLDTPTEEAPAYRDRPEVRAFDALAQIADATTASLHEAESMPGEPVAGLMLDKDTSGSFEITVDSHPVHSLSVVRDEVGNEFLEGDFGPYTIRRVIARGSRSVVYAAQHKERGDEVALKVLDMTPAAAARFFTERSEELLEAARLTGSQVVRILDVGRVQERYYVALEYIDGWTLEEMMDAGDRPSFVRVAEIGRDLAGALAAAEALGVMHLDVRPDHVIVAESGEALLSGFGFAPERPGLDPAGPKVRGTPEFMAPEQLLGRPDPRSDLYGLGATLYRVLAGQVPFPGAVDDKDLMQQVVSSPPLDPREIDPTIPDGLAEIVLRLLEKKPEDRPRTAREVYEAFEQAFFDLEAAGFAEESAEPGPPAIRPLLLGTALASVPLLGASVAAALGIGGTDLSGLSTAEVALDGALFGAVALIAATLLFSTIALVRRGQIPLPRSSAWLVRLQEGSGAVGALLLVAASVLAAPAILNVMVAAIAVMVLGSGIFGTLLRRAVARARSDGGVGRMLAVLGDPLVSRWRLVHVPLIVCLTALASARFAVMAYFASA